MNKIIKYLYKKTGVELFSYGETILVNNGGHLLYGHLFFTGTGSAIRFNWIDQGQLKGVKSIEFWDSFEFVNSKTNPIPPANKTMVIESGESIVKHVPELIENVSKLLSLELKNDYILERDQFEEDEKDIKIDDFEVNIYNGSNTSSTISSITQLDDEADQELSDAIDIFELIQLYTYQIASGNGNSFIITGQAGVGKTADVTSTLHSMGLKEGIGYVKISGGLSAVGLYQSLFVNHDKLILIDDCDDVFTGSDNQLTDNILKAALDTKEKRDVSRVVSGYWNAVGMDMVDILSIYETGHVKTEEFKYDSSGNLIDYTKLKGKYPNRFEFTGRVIFITNLDAGSDISDALISRSLHIDVNLSRDQVLERMEKIMQYIKKNVDPMLKQQALWFLNYVTRSYECKFPLNLRSLVHAINIRNGMGDRTIKIKGRDYPAWEIMIKQNLVVPKAKRIKK